MTRPYLLGVFGGTFDPPHIAHLVLAEEALAQLELDKILWVLTPFPPHKSQQALTPLALRVEMLAGAIADHPAFELSRVDLDRPPPHYAVDTVQILRESYPGASLAYLMGGDSLRDLPAWRWPAQFVQGCDLLGVMRRPGAAADVGAVETQLPGISVKIRWIQAPLLEISASAIRARIANSQPYRYFLPERVYRLIFERGLYSGGI
jgi:nicotinate-nucleotide adenylyltransferase